MKIYILQPLLCVGLVASTALMGMDDTVKLGFRALSGAEIFISSSYSATYGDLKNLLAAELNVDSEDLRIIFAGKLVPGTDTVESRFDKNPYEREHRYKYNVVIEKRDTGANLTEDKVKLFFKTPDQMVYTEAVSRSTTYGQLRTLLAIQLQCNAEDFRIMHSGRLILDTDTIAERFNSSSTEEKDPNYSLRLLSHPN